jgi:AcrR family transcriptional regulator
MGRRSGSRNLDYASTREQIVARLASGILATDRAHLSFRELAHAASVPPSTLRHYFPDRRQVLQAVLEHVHDLGLRYVAEGATAERGDVRESLRWFLGFLVEGWSRGVGRAHAFGLTEGLGEEAIGPAYLRNLLEPTLHSAEARIALHMARGELGPCDARLAAVELVAPLVLVLLHQRALGGASVRQLDVGAFLDEHVSRFLRAFAPAAAASQARPRGPGAGARRRSAR